MTSGGVQPGCGGAGRDANHGREPDGPPSRWSTVQKVGSSLPPAAAQVERLISLGLHRDAGVSSEELRTAVPPSAGEGVLVAIRHDRVPASRLSSQLSLNGRKAFMVPDMSDVDDFVPIASLPMPASPIYLLHDLDRGDAMSNWSPDEALAAIQSTGRTPLTLTEGLHWLLQRPDVLQRGHCYMTIGSRRHKPDGSLDARTPAVWISNGTGRDGPANRNAPKIGWCWAGNRHTWLGFASAGSRNSTSD